MGFFCLPGPRCTGSPGPCTGGETADCRDNCLDVANGAQGNSGGDGFGDACDPDYDNDGDIDQDDADALDGQLGLTESDPSFDGAFDHDDDGTIGPADVAIMGTADVVRKRLLQLRDIGVTDLNAAVVPVDGRTERTMDLLVELAGEAR